MPPLGQSPLGATATPRIVLIRPSRLKRSTSKHI